MSGAKIFDTRKKTAQTATPIFVSRKDSSASSPTAYPATSAGHNFGQMRVTSEQSPVAESCPVQSAPSRCPFGGACHLCPPRIQAKLGIRQPGDAYEWKADRMAEAVVRIPEQAGHCVPGCSPSLQRLASDSPAADYVPADLEEVLNSPGKPLDGTIRAFMESRFGYDFGHVRVHADAQAGASAQALNARAYTVGCHVVFGTGQFSPDTTDGKKLIAHELAHTIQQSRGQTPARSTMNPETATEDSYEREARTAAQDIFNDTSVDVGYRIGAATIQRLPQAVVAAAAVMGRYAARCIVSALIGALIDLGFQAVMHGIRQRTWRVWEMTVDYCSLVLAAVLGCVGGMVSLRWLEPWLDATLGRRLGGAAGTLLGRLLIWVVSRVGIAIPRWPIKWLARWGCISALQAETIAPGITSERDESAEGEAAGAAEQRP